MTCKKPECLKGLIEVVLRDGLFEKGLKKTEFKCFIEVLGNASRKKLKHCFGKKVRRGLKKFKPIIAKLLSKKKTSKKRKKILENAPQQFRNFIKLLFKDFMNNCISADDVEHEKL